MGFQTTVKVTMAVTLLSDRPLSVDDVDEALFEMDHSFDLGGEVVQVCHSETLERELISLNGE